MGSVEIGGRAVSSDEVPVQDSGEPDPGWGPVGFVDRVLMLIVAGNTLAMMLITFVDVFARYVFHAPLRGAYEVLGFMLAVIVFAGLPVLTRAQEHISIRIVETIRSPLGNAVQRVAVSVFSAMLLALMAWQLWRYARLLAEGPQVTGFLELPYSPIAQFMSAMCALATLAALGAAFSSLPRSPRQ